MTAGMEGKTRQASRASLLGVNVATICKVAALLLSYARVCAPHKRKAQTWPWRPTTYGNLTVQDWPCERHLCTPWQRDSSVPHLVSQLLNEDEAADEDIGVRNVLLELLIVLAIPQLLQEVSHHLKAHLLNTKIYIAAVILNPRGAGGDRSKVH